MHYHRVAVVYHHLRTEIYCSWASPPSFSRKFSIPFPTRLLNISQGWRNQRQARRRSQIAPPDFGQIRSKICSIKRPCITYCLPEFHTFRRLCICQTWLTLPSEQLLRCFVFNHFQYGLGTKIKPGFQVYFSSL